MPIITDAELASYLEVNVTSTLTMKVGLANGLVEELLATPLPNPMPTRVKAITLEVAARAVLNPKGYASETVDDYTYRREADTRRAGVYLTDGEREELLGIAGGPRGAAFSISVYSPLDLP